jgi:dTDP-4-dehydrorhamnose reductase
VDESMLIIGSDGQLGKALAKRYPGAQQVNKDILDITDARLVNNFDWKGVKFILNAAAYTSVDGAETTEGRVEAWRTNALAVTNICKAALKNSITLVHISSDYVFDGTRALHTENETFSPLNVYGQTKAAGDLIVSMMPKHYILRTSWLIGEGDNFIRTMLKLGQQGVNPAVVSDQIGRLTFTSELLATIDHIINNEAAYGTYNASNNGDLTSWAEISRMVFQEAGLNVEVTDITAADYYRDKPGSALRPLNSGFDLSKITATGFKSTNWHDDLVQYVSKEINT